MRRAMKIIMLLVFLFIASAACESSDGGKAIISQNDSTTSNDDGSDGDSEDDGDSEIEEEFLDVDKPTYDLFTYGPSDEYSYKFQMPWNYDKIHNAAREYPLVVTLHGHTTLTDHYWAPLIANRDEQMKTYPCFFLAPNNSTLGWGANAVWLRQLIEEMKASYRIDENRIYVVGFSMGGSGLYEFVSYYYDEHTELVAGILRFAGMSQTSLRDEIADKTSIWYNVGMDDSSTIINVAESAYQFIKSYSGNALATESLVNDTVDGHARLTKTLTLNGIEIMKKSEYTGVGHEANTALTDPELLAWLFRQSLDKR